VLLAKQLFQQAKRLRAAAAAAVASRSDFATASGFNDFASASGLDDGATAVASVMLAEQLLEQSAFANAATAVAASGLATASGFDDVATARSGCFASASRLGDDFTAASRFCTTAITAVATKITEQAERVSVGRCACDHCDGQQSWDDYTTHRDSP
jgi:hypothetical protein